jgi:hypothetical protein
MSALAGVCGALVGLGLFLIVCWWRGDTVLRPSARLRARWTRKAIERRTLRLGLAILAGIVVGAVTGWPVGAVLAAAAGFGAPLLLSGSRGRAEDIARIEAIAGWAEMLRDTMAGAAGLEQAIVATATVAPLSIRTEVATRSPTRRWTSSSRRWSSLLNITRSVSAICSVRSQRPHVTKRRCDSGSRPVGRGPVHR